jgi:serine protease Do
MQLIEPTYNMVLSYLAQRRRLKLYVAFSWLTLVMLLVSPPIAFAQAGDETAPPSIQSKDGNQENPISPDADVFLKAMHEKSMRVAERSSRSVVSIARVRRDTDPRTETLRFQFGPGVRFNELDRPSDPDFVPTDYATGVVIDNEGHIVTCFSELSDPRSSDYYVWSQKEPRMAQPTWVPVEVQAGDPFSNIAVLKVRESIDLVPIEVGLKHEAQKGELVFAVGNPYAAARDGSTSMAWGIIANIDRSLAGIPGETASLQEKQTLHHFGGLLQVDANLSNGFNGGPVLNLDGQMIGMVIPNAFVPTAPKHGGFAIPTDATFMRAVESLKQGKIPEFGFLGIVPEEIPPSRRESGIRGAYVSRVVPGLPGDLAGLRPDDVIMAVNGAPVFDRNSLFFALSRQGAEEEVELSVRRYGSFGGTPENMTLKGQLSKKYVASKIPAYTIHPPPSWKGLSVEYATALPTEMLRFMSRSLPTPPKLAALQVEPNTPAWQAGIRPGQLILSVQGEPVTSPDQFTELVNRFSGQSIEISLIDAADTLRKLTVP